MGEVDLDFKWAASHFHLQISSAVAVVAMKIWLLLTSRNQFSKAPTASSMLNLSRESEDCLAFFFCQAEGYCDFQFKSHRMKKIFQSVLTFCYEIIRSGKHHPLKNCKGRRTPEKVFLRWIDKIDVEGKQFITTDPTRIHTKDGRTYNGNLRYTIRPIEDAINYFHERQGLRH